MFLEVVTYCYYPQVPAWTWAVNKYGQYCNRHLPGNLRDNIWHAKKGTVSIKVSICFSTVDVPLLRSLSLFAKETDKTTEETAGSWVKTAKDGCFRVPKYIGIGFEFILVHGLKFALMDAAVDIQGVGLEPIATDCNQSFYGAVDVL